MEGKRKALPEASSPSNKHIKLSPDNNTTNTNTIPVEILPLILEQYVVDTWESKEVNIMPLGRYQNHILLIFNVCFR